MTAKLTASTVFARRRRSSFRGSSPPFLTPSPSLSFVWKGEAENDELPPAEDERSGFKEEGRLVTF